MNLLVLLAIGALVVGAVFYAYQFYNSKAPEVKQQYLGPVPEGFDEQHYRETGITKPLVEVVDG